MTVKRGAVGKRSAQVRHAAGLREITLTGRLKTQNGGREGRRSATAHGSIALPTA
jgi:hypothetical protein